VLLDRRLLKILPKALDIGRDVQRLDVGDLAELVMIAPGEEPNAGLCCTIFHDYHHARLVLQSVQSLITIVAWRTTSRHVQRHDPQY
jgi:hypothetical protein